MAGENPDFGSTDLWDAIERGDFPSWTVYWQVMNATQAETFKCKSRDQPSSEVIDLNTINRQHLRFDEGMASRGCPSP